ncbi:hypothetical protein K440DRAFT_609119 [Wilcoxina mikolae CBS 423.85]|nr:hypothetical protein K440DRAFT_609119 [Wilcoxina mikolae CBS 423.85]
MSSPPPEPEPEPTTPQLSFDPPLQIQRQFTIHEISKSLATTPRISGNLTKLLDVGCGDATLIRRLIPCDDLLPLSHMTGIDIIPSPTWPSLKQPTLSSEDRWYGLDINLFLGSFEELEVADVGYHDVVVSAEVIEHLDPGPLSNFAAVLLGRLKPRVCVVTTPNRDFNALFDYLESLDLSVEKFEGFRREGVPYRMRHHDHRFEWTRREFRVWAREAAEKFGYDVEFTGAGGLGRGMVVVGEDVDRVLREAAEACGSKEEIPSGVSEWGDMKGLVCPVDDTDEGQHVLRRAFGDCSQIAVFVIKPGVEKEPPVQNTGGGAVQRVHTHTYEFQKEEEFPPSLRAVLEPLMIGGRLLRFVPEFIVDEWLKGSEDSQYSWPEDNAWTGQSLDDNALRERERLTTQLGGKPVKIVEVVIEAQRLWEETYALQRVCHYRYEVFLDVINGIEGIESPQTIVDTVSLKIDTQAQQGESIVTATFPAKNKKKSMRQTHERLMYVENGYDEFQQHERDEFEPEEYVDDDSRGYYPSDEEEEDHRWDINSEAGSTEDGDVEFDTVIEWVVGSKSRLPPWKEGVEGTLCLGEMKGERLLRVRFFGPTRDFEIPSESQGDEEVRVEELAVEELAVKEVGNETWLQDGEAGEI